MRLEWSHHEGRDCLRVIGAAGRQLRVHPSSAIGDTLPSVSMAGRFMGDGDTVCFVPQFPFRAGTEYTVLVHRGGSAADLEDHDLLTILCPAVAGAPTTAVMEIFPTAATVPRNLLRLYIHFSAPMSEGRAAQHISVRRAAGRASVEDVFLPMDPELWDPSRTRLTVLFDPARIKRGLVPHHELGYPLEVGVAVEVVVDAAFHDAAGRPLVDGAVRRYEIGDDLRGHVDPSRWQVDPPGSHTTDPLLVHFDRPMDRALAQRCLTVVGANDTRVRGATAVDRGETEWRFKPTSAWDCCTHHLVVDPVLEDLAGNSVTRVFDRDLTDATDTPNRQPTISRSFAPRVA